MWSGKVSRIMTAGQTYCMKIHNMWQVLPFDNPPSPPFITFNTSPPPPVLSESAEAILIWLSLYALLLAKCFTKWAALEMPIQTGMWTWVVMSAATCSSPSVFLLSSARPLAASLILSALRLQDLGASYRGRKGNGRWWFQCNLILSKTSRLAQRWRCSRQNYYL